MPIKEWSWLIHCFSPTLVYFLRINPFYSTLEFLRSKFFYEELRFKEFYSKWKNPTFASCLTIGKQSWKIHLFKNIYLLSFQVKSMKIPAKPSLETHSDTTLTHPHQWFSLGPWKPPGTNRFMSACSDQEHKSSKQGTVILSFFCKSWLFGMKVGERCLT